MMLICSAYKRAEAKQGLALSLEKPQAWLRHSVDTGSPERSNSYPFTRLSSARLLPSQGHGDSSDSFFLGTIKTIAQARG